MVTGTVEVPVKILEMPKDLVDRGMAVLAMKDQMKHFIRELMTSLSAELAKNNIQSAKLWSEVQEECKKQGITIESDEGIFFNYVIEKYYISKIKKVNE